MNVIWAMFAGVFDLMTYKFELPFGTFSVLDLWIAIGMLAILVWFITSLSGRKDD